MSYSLDTRKTKYLHNYEAALRHHDSITPIRNSNCRPIAERRKQHFNIRKHGDSIIVRLYATDLVTYTPDNKITLNMGGRITNTVSTRAAIYAITNTTISQQHSRTWVRDHDGKCFLFQNGMQLQAGDYYCNHKIIDPIHPVVHHLDKQNMKALRKDYAPFTKHLSGFIKLVGETGFDRDMLEGVPWTMPDQTVLSLAKGTHVQMHEAALFIACSVKKNPGYYLPVTVRLKDALAEFDKHIIRGHRDTVLTRSTVTDGSMVKDRYAWAVG
jgi:hypothetical protein